jgi:hypothetical protein
MYGGLPGIAMKFLVLPANRDSAAKHSSRMRTSAEMSHNHKSIIIKYLHQIRIVLCLLAHRLNPLTSERSPAMKRKAVTAYVLIVMLWVAVFACLAL